MVEARGIERSPNFATQWDHATSFEFPQSSFPAPRNVAHINARLVSRPVPSGQGGGGGGKKSLGRGRTNSHAEIFWQKTILVSVGFTGRRLAAQYPADCSIQLLPAAGAFLDALRKKSRCFLPRQLPEHFTIRGYTRGGLAQRLLTRPLPPEVRGLVGTLLRGLSRYGFQRLCDGWLICRLKPWGMDDIFPVEIAGVERVAWVSNPKMHGECYLESAPEMHFSFC